MNQQFELLRELRKIVGQVVRKEIRENQNNALKGLLTYRKSRCAFADALRRKSELSLLDLIAVNLF